MLALHGERHWWIAGMRHVVGAVSGPAQGRVLDIGCGPGWDLIELPEGVRGVGLDRSAAHVFYRPLVLGQASWLPFASATSTAYMPSICWINVKSNRRRPYWRCVACYVRADWPSSACRRMPGCKARTTIFGAADAVSRGQFGALVRAAGLKSGG